MKSFAHEHTHTHMHSSALYASRLETSKTRNGNNTKKMNKKKKKEYKMSTRKAFTYRERILNAMQCNATAHRTTKCQTVVLDFIALDELVAFWIRLRSLAHSIWPSTVHKTFRCIQRVQRSILMFAAAQLHSRS